MKKPGIVVLPVKENGTDPRFTLSHYPLRESHYFLRRLLLSFCYAFFISDVCVFWRDREIQSEKSSLPFYSFYTSLSSFHNLFCYSESVCVYSLAFSLSHTFLFLLLLLSTLDFEKKVMHESMKFSVEVCAHAPCQRQPSVLRSDRISSNPPSTPGSRDFSRVSADFGLQTLMTISLTNFFIGQI